MAIPRYAFFEWFFNAGRGILKNQIDWSVDDAEADAYVQSLATSGVLPAGSAARRSLRWNETNSNWESFSSESTWYFALTASVDMQPIADVMIDALTNGFNRRVRGSNATHYNPAVGEVVLGRWNLPRYPIYGANNSWAADGDADAVAAFGVSPVYSWVILPADVAGEAIQNRFWTIAPIGGGSGEAAGVFDNIPAFTEVNMNLIIDGVTYRAARARIEWEAGTVNYGFNLGFSPMEDAPTAVWQAP